MQTYVGPVIASSVSVSLCTLLSWLRGTCSPGDLYPCGSYSLSASIFEGFPVI